MAEFATVFHFFGLLLYTVPSRMAFQHSHFPALPFGAQRLLPEIVAGYSPDFLLLYVVVYGLCADTPVCTFFLQPVLPLKTRAGSDLDKILSIRMICKSEPLQGALERFFGGQNSF